MAAPRLSSYELLDGREVRAVISYLGERIDEYLPRHPGLRSAAEELGRLVDGLLDRERTAPRRRRAVVWISRVLIAVVLVTAVLTVGAAVRDAVSAQGALHAFEWLPVLESGISDLVFAGIAIWFLLSLADRLVRRDVGLVRDLEVEARAALRWIDDYADLQGNGYVSYQRRNEQTGLENQCWKDSWDSISYRDGRLPGFPRVLDAVARAYHERPDDITKSAGQIMDRLASLETVSTTGSLDPELPQRAAKALVRHVDQDQGGLGGAPKFPHPAVFQLFLRRYRVTRDPALLDAVTLTADRMAAGGIYDHVGGGFHRYSVDARWLVSSAWTRASILNVARMAWFSSDRTIREYAEEIWNVPVNPTTPVLPDLRNAAG